MTGAYQFVCVCASTEILWTRLNALGEWQWSIGDSHWYGDYVACQPFAGVRIRICDFPEQVESEYRYRADVRRASDCKTATAVIDAEFRKVLSAIGAHDIREIEWFD
jgi:hypothetical protein